MKTPRTDTRSRLVNRYADQYKTMRRLEEDLQDVVDEMQECADEIYGDDYLITAIRETGVRCGIDQVILTDPSGVRALLVKDMAKVPYSWELDEREETGHE
jgi:hypothetical protein